MKLNKQLDDGKKLMNKTETEEKNLMIKFEDEARRKLLLSNKKVYDYYSKPVLCPYCVTYSVIYSNKWLCNKCDRNIVIKNSNSNHPFGSIDADIAHLKLKFTNRDLYAIYRHYGIEPLVKLTDRVQHEICELIRVYEIEEVILIRKFEEEEKLRRDEARRKLLLSNNKIYDSECNLLFCPHCNNYSVQYFNKINKWSCNCQRRCKNPHLWRFKIPHPYI